MAKKTVSKSKGGARVITYGEPSAKGGVAIGDTRSMAAIERHINTHVGKVEFVWHEIYSEIVHIDVHLVSPDKSNPHARLVTTGMSDRAMRAPRGAEECSHAELAISLPAWWKIDERSFSSPKWSWPMAWLRILARFPHEFDTWLFYSHTMPLSEIHPATGSNFCGVVMGIDSEFPEKFWRLKSGKKQIHFMTPIPVFPEEMAFALDHGSEALLERLATIPNPWDCYDPARPNTVAKAAQSRKRSVRKR